MISDLETKKLWIFGVFMYGMHVNDLVIQYCSIDWNGIEKFFLDYQSKEDRQPVAQIIS